jgi:hypothetical protein
MTVVISLICENGKKKIQSPSIVLCGDRLLTNEQEVTYEQLKPKFSFFSKNGNTFALLNSGDAANSNIIYSKIESIIDQAQQDKEHRLTMSEFSNTLKQAIMATKEEEINATILNPINLNVKEFYKNIKKFPEWLAKDLIENIKKFSLNIDFIIAGFDINKRNRPVPHLNYIDDENLQINSLDESGFGIIGIGEVVSTPDLTKELYKSDISLSEGIQKAYWAKKAAEKVSGVGSKSTDIGIMWCSKNGNGVYKINNYTFDESFAKNLEDEHNKFIENNEKFLKGTAERINSLMFDIKR